MPDDVSLLDAEPTGLAGSGDEHADAPADATLERLRSRLDPIHLRQRLGMESAHGKAVFGYGRTFFHLENWYSIHALIRFGLRALGLYARGERNAAAIRVTANTVRLAALPAAFDGLRLLHLTDLHLDAPIAYNHALVQAVLAAPRAEYTLITGDFRYRTHGDWQLAIEHLAALRPHLPGPVYAVLGNHDSIRMVPAIEDLDIRLLLNESVRLERDGARIHLAGIDDPHYFCADNFHRAARDVPVEEVAILLSHSPETYWQAAHCGFDLLLAGHTHGGQVCLPGGLALMTNADCPRAYCRGAWRYRELQGYTSTGAGSSVVPVRYNCPPEVVVHTLQCG